MINNKEWFFSGIGVLIIGILVKFFHKKEKINISAIRSLVTNIFINKDIKQNSFNNKTSPSIPIQADILQEAKSILRILFIDDDPRFKVVNIFKKSGWVNTSRVKDIGQLDSHIVLDTHIFFVDIQGVGKELGFNDEGLGLALALKEKYPNKKVVIYSAESRGDRFHKALRKADSSLPKNAEPYEFLQEVDDFAIEFLKNNKN